MKTLFTLKPTTKKWKTTGGTFILNKYGGEYTGGENMDFIRARKRVLKSLKIQGREYRETYADDGTLTITAG